MHKSGMRAAIAAAAVAWPLTVSATTFYVSSAGSNANLGTSISSPLGTIQYAAGLTHPGDTVLIMGGTYTNSAPGDNVLLVSRSGTQTAPIVYAAYPGQRPVLAFTSSWAAIKVAADYIVLDGFEIAGNAENMPVLYALTHMRDLNDPVMNGGGISIGPNLDGTTTHHVTVENMLIHDVLGNGIAVEYSDYVTIENNVVHNTSNWSPYGDSGISLLWMSDVDGSTSVKSLVLNNVVFDNAEYVACVCRDYASISDGNGIIIDDNIHAEDGGVPYGGRTVAAFNVSYDNGGSGLQAFSSQHVDLVDNTAYNNDLTGSSDGGQIYAEDGSDVNIVNDILVAPAGKLVTSSVGNTSSVVETSNILWNIGGAVLTSSVHGPNDMFADPLLRDPQRGDMSLLTGSPALGSAEPVALINESVAGAAVLPAWANRGAK